MQLKAILFDLDDTLLVTNMEQFIPKYLNALGNKLKVLMEPQKLVALILESTQAMIENQNPDLLNAEVFYNHFYSKVTFSKVDFKALVEEFYEVDFPKLKIHTDTIPLIPEFISDISAHNYKLVIATNPLFPAKAIEHRIAWAGLSGVNFDLVTTYENSHFCKPSPRYYLEILDKLNISPGEAMMVGDDFKNDILPAESIGMKSFLINEESLNRPSGTIHQFFYWFRKQNWLSDF